MMITWRRPLNVLGALALAATLSGFTGCVSQNDYNKQGLALEEAKRQLALAENDLARLRAQIDSLKAQLAANQGMSKGLAALQAENILLQDKLNALQKQYDELAKSTGDIRLPEAVNSALADLAEKYPELLEWDPKLGRLRFKSDLTFDLGSTEVKPAAREALETLAGILDLKEISANQIRIVGHTDDVPIRSSNGLNPNNWLLSSNRAHAIREVLHADGVSDTRIQAAGEGPTHPIAENAPGRKGNAKNRRVEIFILPTTVSENALPASDSDSRVILSGARAPVAPKKPKPAPVAPVAPVAPATPVVPTVPVVPAPATLPVG